MTQEAVATKPKHTFAPQTITRAEKERAFRRILAFRDEIAKLNIKDWDAEREAAMREQFGHNLDM